MANEKSRRKNPVRSKAKSTSFQLTAPEAKTVTIAGDFNDWDPQANPLKRGKEGVWKVTLRLPSGTYQYKFVVDGGDWREDPLNPNKVQTSFGSFNSVREVA